MLVWFQAICFPLSNYRWTIHKSHVMLALAWVISLLFSLPQVVVYHGRSEEYCIAQFQPNWGAKVGH